MKRYIYILSAAAVMMMTAVTAGAQQGKRWYMGLGWQFNATPSNAVAASAQGWGGYIEGGYYLTPKLAVGAFANFSTNNRYFPKRTFHSEDGSEALTSDFSRSLYQIPFGATVRYRFARHKVQPYVEARFGANYSEQSTYFPAFRAGDSNWGFYVSPEAGLTVHPFSRTDFGFQFAIYYAYATNRSPFYGMNGVNNLGFKLGIAF